MLVYANHFQFQGAGAEDAIFKAIGGWLKEQLGFGLHPDQIRQEGEFNGHRGELRSWLRVYATDEGEPALYAWVLKNLDDSARGRQWITELGLKKTGQDVAFSCVVKTDEYSTLAARSPVTASRPRVIGYITNNVLRSPNASFTPSVAAVEAKAVGEDMDSYRALHAEIERRERDCPLVIVSPTRDGDYLLNVEDLQEKLIGLGQVVQICRGFNSYDMADVIGQQRSAWGGAVNVLYTPLPTGVVRNRLFRSEEILEWGNTPHDRISHLLAWVTNNTNIPRLRKHIRPEGVLQLALRRRMQAVRANSEQMNVAQLRDELEESSKRADAQDRYFNDLVNENSGLLESVAEFKEAVEEAEGEIAKKDYVIQSLKDQLSRARNDHSGNVDVKGLCELACRDDPPLPLECLDLIEKVYGDSCIVLPSARNSAEEMGRFVNGRQLMSLLKKLVTEYRGKLMSGGDNQARTVFGKNDYAAKESETVMANKAMRRQRTFTYEGEDVEMFRHLKIGVEDDATKTIRVHFHWDADKEKIVIGYCGKHLPVSSR
jgi:hypothetical protein